MTQPPPDDQDLVSFLRHHRSNPPPGDPALEDRILQSLPQRSRRRLWVVPSAIAATLVGAIVSYQFLRPTPSEPVDTASIEAYMESNWTALNSNPDLQIDSATNLALEGTE